MERVLSRSHRRQLLRSGWHFRTILWDEMRHCFLTEDGCEIYMVHQIVPPWALALAKKSREENPGECFEFLWNGTVTRIVWIRRPETRLMEQYGRRIREGLDDGFCHPDEDLARKISDWTGKTVRNLDEIRAKYGFLGL